MHSDPDLTVHFEYMAIALFIAYKAMVFNETPVACIFTQTSTGKVLALGYNDTNRSLNGTRHAEFMALDHIMSHHIPQDKKTNSDYLHTFFADVTLYVTVEPCIMCASALKQVGIGRVIYGCGNDRFGGNGTVLAINRDDIPPQNYPSFGGILRTEAIQLLRNFYTQENDTAPVPQVKKNKQLAGKEYPAPFTNAMHPVDAAAFFGDNRWTRMTTEGNTREVTPIEASGYSLRSIVSCIEWPLCISEVYDRENNDQWKSTIAGDLEHFYRLFYDVGSDGAVDFSKDITTITDHSSKRMKLELTA